MQHCDHFFSCHGFSSLYIGILAATQLPACYYVCFWFQFPLHRDPRCNLNAVNCRPVEGKFQFPLHRDPRCNQSRCPQFQKRRMFQFPLHRDPRCNKKPHARRRKNLKFQFPLHRDPRCNGLALHGLRCQQQVSVPFTSGSSLQRLVIYGKVRKRNGFSSLYIGILAATVVAAIAAAVAIGFSSLYIGILAATPAANLFLGYMQRFSSLYIGILAATRSC